MYDDKKKKKKKKKKSPEIKSYKKIKKENETSVLACSRWTGPFTRNTIILNVGWFLVRRLYYVIFLHDLHRSFWNCNEKRLSSGFIHIPTIFNIATAVSKNNDHLSPAFLVIVRFSELLPSVTLLGRESLLFEVLQRLF